MYLYDKKDNNFDVYSVEGIENDIIAYRRKEIEQIPYEKRILVYRDTNSDWLIAYGGYPTFGEGQLNYSNINNDERESILSRYYQGQYKLSGVQVIRGSSGLRYLLDTERKYSRDSRDLRSVQNIIELPKTLYALQMFEQEHFNYLEGEDISKLVDLFKVSKVDEISIPQLQKLDGYGFTENVYDKVCQTANAHNKVLSLIKKK